MYVRSKTYIQRTGVTLVWVDAFLFTISQIVVNCFMKSVSKFSYTLSLKIYQTINAFYFSEKHIIIFTESYRA